MVIEPSAENLLLLFFRRKKAFVITSLFVMALGAAYLIVATPRYRSEASVVVRFDEKSLPDTNLARDTSAEVISQNDRHETMLANAEILNSPDLIREVILSMGLDRLYPKIVEDPPTKGTPLDEAVRVFGKNFDVDPGVQGNVIEVWYQHPDPDIAQQVLKRIIAAYMKREAEVFSGSDYTFQRQQVESARTQLTSAQDALQTFKKQTGITAFQDEMTALIQQRGDLQGSLEAAKVSLAQGQERHAQLQALLAKVEPYVENSASGEKYHAIDDAQARLADLRVREQQMLATYRSNSPMLDPLRASIATAQADLNRKSGAASGRRGSEPNVVYQNIQTDLLRASAEEKAFADSVTVLQGEIAGVDKTLQEKEAQRSRLTDLERTVDIADSAYRSLSLHLEDARIVENRVRDRISHGAVITEPSLPYKAASPRYLIVGIGVAIGGLLVGFGAIILLELMDDRFFNVQQVEQRLDVPVLAAFGEPTW